MAMLVIQELYAWNCYMCFKKGDDKQEAAQRQSSVLAKGFKTNANVCEEFNLYFSKRRLRASTNLLRDFEYIYAAYIHTL